MFGGVRIFPTSLCTPPFCSGFLGHIRPVSVEKEVYSQGEKGPFPLLPSLVSSTTRTELLTTPCTDLHVRTEERYTHTGRREGALHRVGGRHIYQEGYSSYIPGRALCASYSLSSPKEQP